MRLDATAVVEDEVVDEVELEAEVESELVVTATRVELLLALSSLKGVAEALLSDTVVAVPDAVLDEIVGSSLL